MAVIDTATVRILPDFSGFTRQVRTELDSSLKGVTASVDKGVKSATDSVAKSTTGMASRVKGSLGTVKGAFLGAFAGTAVLGGLAGVVGGIRGAISAASDLGETTSKVGQIFGQSALPELQKFAAGAAAALGQSKQQALDAAATFGVFGKSAGLSGGELVGFSTKLTGLATDMASFSNTTPQEAIDALGAALRGESEPIRRYGVLLDEGSVQAEGLRLGLVKATGDTGKIAIAQQKAMLAQKAYNKAVKEHGADSDEAARANIALQTATAGLKKATEGTIPPLSQQQKVLARQSLILAQTKDQQGDFARTSGGLANQQRKLTAQWNNAKTTLGGLLLPAATAVVKVFNGMFSVLGTLSGPFKALTGFVKENQTAFKAIAAVIGAALIPALIRSGVQATLWAARQVAAGAAAVASYIRAGLAATASAVRQVAAWVLVGTQSLIQAARVAAAWLIAMGPIALVVAAVVALVVVVVKNWDKIRNAITVAATAVLNFLKRNWPLILAILTGPIGLAVLAIARNWDKIKAGAGAVKNFVVDKFKAMVDFVKSLPGKIGRAAGGMWDGIKNAFRSAINFIIRGWNNLQFRIPGFSVGPVKFGGFTLGLPDIPQLQAGGIVKRPTLAALAERGRPEAVIPLERLGDFGGGRWHPDDITDLAVQIGQVVLAGIYGGISETNRATRRRVQAGSTR
jgi:hypothetical protein